MPRRYPPGPANYSAWIGLTWRHAFRLWWDALGFLDQLRTYGDISFFRLFGVRAYAVNHPELIREVLVTQREKFHKLPRDVRAVRQIVGQGVLVSEGDFWRRQRRLLQPAFHMSRMEHCATAAVEQAARMLQRWADAKTVDVPAEMSDVTMRIAAQAMFTIDLGPQDGELVTAARTLSTELIGEIHALFTLPDWLPLPHKRRKREAIRIYDKLMREIIRQRRATGESSSDLLSMLLAAEDETGDGQGMDDEQVRDEAMTAFTAAFHASSMALTWTWYLLATHPDVFHRVVEEVDATLQGRPATFADLDRLVYTQAVLKESLRLYPPAWALFCRQAQEDLELGGYRVPRRSWVFVFPYVIHRDARFFPDPLRFDPERFSAARAQEILPYAYIPFGAGPRACIGSAFAMVEMTLIVATVLQHYLVELSPAHAAVRPNALLALRPHPGLELGLHARSPVCHMAPL